MSTENFSNTSTGDKPADPHRKLNIDTDVPLKEKIETLETFVKSSKYGMMTTRDLETGSLVSRCMALAATLSGGIDLLFFTNTESNKTNELKSDPHINVSFLNSSGEWASVAGECTIETDRELVKKYYSPTLKAWLGDLGDGVHDGGENDPRIGGIRVKATSATYSVVNKNLLGRVAEVAQGTLTGKPAQVNKIREITKDEIDEWRKVV